MFFEGEPIAIIWEIHSVDRLTVVQSRFDVITVDYNGLVTYFVDPMTDYVRPKDNSDGSMTFTFTPDRRGPWKVLLVTGVSSNYTILDTVQVPVGCDPPIVSLNTKVITSFVYHPDCIVKPRILEDFVESAFNWYHIGGITLHGTANEIAFIGQKVNGLNYLSSGVYNYETDTIVTENLNCFPAGVSILGVSITYSPLLALYVALPQQSANNFYDTLYSTDLINWSHVDSSPSSKFHGARFVNWDRNHKVFYHGTGVALFTSINGKDWFHQQNELIQNVIERDSWLHSGVLPDFPDRGFIGGFAQRFNYCDDTTGIVAPILPGNYHNTDVPIFLVAGASESFHGLTTDGKHIYINTLGGSFARSLTGELGSWEIIAETNGPVTNVFIDTPITIGFLEYINGQFWTMSGSGGVGNWWFSDDDCLTWTQSDNGHFGITRLNSPNHSRETIRYENNIYAYCGSTINFVDHIYVAKNIISNVL